MKKLTSVVATGLVTLFTHSMIFALPGATQSIPDISGEYVFYRDFTFERESYTGVVYYNDSTYGVRYYAPAVDTKKTSLAERDIQIYFTIDATKDHFEPTGERIAGTVTPDDTDVINYLHDMLYELTARREKAGDVSSSTSVTQDFQQFGGEVTLLFNPLVPVFNLEGVQSLDGNMLLQVVTTGMLSAAEGEHADTSFTDFKGFPPKVTDKAHVFKRNKKAQKSQFSYSKDEHILQELTLDTGWTQYADNFFFLGKNALVTFDVATPAATAAKEDYGTRLLRRFLQSNPNSFTNWTTLTTKKSGSRTIASIAVYDQNAHSMMQLFRVLDELSDGSVAFLLLSVYDSTYSKNKAYFDDLLTSYKVHAN